MKKYKAYFLVVAFLCVWSCAKAPEQKRTSFETITLKRETVELPRFFSATVEGKKDVVIAPQTSGQLMEVCVGVGEKVRKGQVMFRIDDRQARNRLNACKADLIAAQAQMETARLEYESNKNLYEKEIVSSYMLNTSKNGYDRAKAAVDQVKAAVDQAELDLEFCTIFAPVDGLVGNIVNNPGDLVSPAVILTTVSGTEEMKVRFSISELMFHKMMHSLGTVENVLKNAPPIHLILKSGDEYDYTGKLERISGQVDKTTGAVVLEAYFPNPEGKLFSGIQGTARMDIRYDDVIAIPLTAVVRIQDKTLVYVVKNNCAKSTVVTIEEGREGEHAAVLSGADAGDVIVAKGVSNIVDGMQVLFPEEKRNGSWIKEIFLSIGK